MKDEIKNIALSDLHAFPDNPFAVREDAELQESVKEHGGLQDGRHCTSASFCA